jgi:hypothetical protein
MGIAADRTTAERKESPWDKFSVRSARMLEQETWLFLPGRNMLIAGCSKAGGTEAKEK